MIISHRYRSIFITTHKAAGSSLEMALGSLCGPDDIVTPMHPNASWMSCSIISDSLASSVVFAQSPASRFKVKCRGGKSNITPGKADFRTYYDEESREKIASAFQREIQLMGYVFPSAS
jgi:hypothetical protein